MAAERLWDGLRWAGSAVLDALLPPHCLTCDAPVARSGQFCAACFAATPFITEPCCARCGVPLWAGAQGGMDRVCHACRTDPPAWSEARAAMLYDAHSKRIVLALKHADRIENARALAPHMVRAGAALLREADWLVPVPLHRRRLIARRYNQAALLTQAVSRLSGRPMVLDGLRRVRATQPLGSQSKQARAVALAGAFAVRTARLPQLVDSRVLLIDDVLTSGATAGACSRALLAAGVARVDVLAASRATDPRFA